MDNLTHSLIGAAIGQAGLKRRTGLAMPALIVAANLPDIDAGCVVFGVESLAMRRGITHGPLAMVVLPLLLAGALWGSDRWQTGRGKRPEGRLPVRFGWLYALCLIGCLTHPLFDWFNNYGIRLLEPFSSEWFYGDSLFIIDPWILAMLGLGIWFSLRRERLNGDTWTRPARLSLASMAIYISLNLGLTVISEVLVGGRWHVPKLSVANPVPVAFWRREGLWRDEESYGTYNLDFPGISIHRAGTDKNTNMSDPRIALWAKGDPAAEAFLFWSRMPIAELYDDRIILRDQRFMDSWIADRFTVTLRPPQ